ncbi:FAD:protein FMN transferase [Frankia sp. R82]|uniref:FAD:protein FMN transferase n=1 Tax=Frankia sp. R82 TaxID=2950553 RepID=UPI0020441D71|nr:FAD:protein FMN transferase [Frankia sp. R82]MCM3883700.1 FAD:protein FMN transferase [Frankia sp. R82]
MNQALATASPPHPIGPGGTASTSWPVWSTTAQVVVTDPGQLDAAVRIVADEIAAVDQTASRFRPDAEIMRLAAADGAPQQVSELLAELIEVALDAARRTGGDVIPTLGGALADLGYDRDLSLLAMNGPPVRTVHRPAPGWRRISLVGRMLTLPADVQVDLGATAKAHTADRAAARVAARLDTGVLVSLGGDIATAGQAPTGGWQVHVADQPGEPTCVVGLASGTAIATSSTLGRRWQRGDRLLHHILDPRTCQPAPTVWRTVTVAASTCVAANTASTAAVVRGPAAPGWLGGLGLPSRLVDADQEITTVAGWPSPPDPTRRLGQTHAVAANGSAEPAGIPAAARKQQVGGAPR